MLHERHKRKKTQIAKQSQIAKQKIIIRLICNNL